ncbi:MAG: hypothetical protein HY996_00570 [Micrococcales bacterium]|nr:hypothetical protein [Micrococcales bacterium]
MTERPALLFDRRDQDLVETINELAERGVQKRHERLRKLFNPFLHPRGIKELSVAREQRIADAVIQLLDSLDGDQAQERLKALASLKDEILEGGSPINAGRVLIEKMKQLVRGRGSITQQLECAHDFFDAVAGGPGVVRRLLRECHLLEMSEKWNQVAYDHHVHDAYTKGRKSPTHLVVDAWIKGIREMTVVYYYCTNLEAIGELVEAAALMGIAVQPGIEMSARQRGKYAQFIWTPLGLQTAREYVDFFARPAQRALFEEGADVIRYNTSQVLDLLRSFNRTRLDEIRTGLEIDLLPIDEVEFMQFVGPGQPAKSHLAEFIYQKVVDCGRAKLPELRASWRDGSAAERRRIEEWLARLEAVAPESLARTHLAWSSHPDVENPNVPHEGEHVPALLLRSCAETLGRLEDLRSGSAITLNLGDLSAADVLEILYDGRGAITHLEIFNVKDHHREPNPDARAIGRLRLVLNTGNPIVFKRTVKEIIQQVEHGREEPEAAKRDRLAKLHAILADFEPLLTRYRRAPLASRTGSDSVGRGRARAGMGLALMPTLPRRTVREFLRHPGTREIVPVHSEAELRTTWRQRRSDLGAIDLLLRAVRRVPGLRSLGYDRTEAWTVVPNATALSDRGNILTLGGSPEHEIVDFPLAEPEEKAPRLRWRYLSKRFKNGGKAFFGLVPAFLTFMLTKDWWLLAYFGAFIWFGITGLRNVIQSVFGGGGLFRSELLHWRDLVSWSRVADSLLFTGFSVPLLDWLVKSVLLDRTLGITTTTAPLALYSAIAVANGTYLLSHNVLRGLPRAAALGNLFRSVLSIPLAFGLNALLVKVLQARGLDAAEASLALQNWAAVIGKLASDTVAGFIEGAADRNVNVRQRHLDIGAKLADLLDVHGRLEVLFPEIDVADWLVSPKKFHRAIGKEAQVLEQQQIVNALDLMYFWMHQPRARAVFESHLERATPEERRIILLTQRLLERDRAISSLFLDDLVGRKYDRALAFYLSKRKTYLSGMQALAAKVGVDWRGKVVDESPTASPVPAPPADSDARAAAGDGGPTSPISS